jgi:hypothetical protein
VLQRSGPAYELRVQRGLGRVNAGVQSIEPGERKCDPNGKQDCHDDGHDEPADGQHGS